MQSTWENRVAWNVSESGVHPLRVEELVETDDERHALLEQALGYPQTNGTLALRERSPRCIRGATADHVQVTNGGSEANCIASWHLVEPGDEVVMMVPNYMQVVRPGARASAPRVVPWPLVATPDAAAPRWRPDLDALASAGHAAHRADPDLQSEQPHRRPVDRAELDGICRIADRPAPGCCPTRSIAARRSTATTRRRCGAATSARSSRAACRRRTACPGLRIGWVVATPALIAELWGVHDYTTIAPGGAQRLPRADRARDRRGARGCSRGRAASSARTIRS